jgi:hypothetical protein
MFIPRPLSSTSATTLEHLGEVRHAAPAVPRSCDPDHDHYLFKAQRVAEANERRDVLLRNQGMASQQR